jgi:hypothetical protein
MSYFSVSPASGSYRTSTHPYKLMFQMKTKVQSCVCPDMPNYGLGLSTIADVCSHTVDHDYLIGMNSRTPYLKALLH